ncbi:sensor histidine kinase [Pelomicrobium sp. G1]|jgi:signal transduction histidine kinase|uniref:sensor histidine kinase n=1 Tax=unclassified Pelomicrobium TaxID=2815318 RepID=UPI003F761408
MTRPPLGLPTLKAKLVAVLLILCSAISALFLVAARLFHDTYHQEITQFVNRALAANFLTESVLAPRSLADLAQLQGALDHLAQVNRDVEIYVLDERGRILMSSLPPGQIALTHVSLAPIRQMLSAEPAFPILGDNPRDPGRKSVFSVAPFALPSGETAFLYVILGGADRDDATRALRRSYAAKEYVLVSLSGVVVAFTAAFISIGLITRPLRRLISAMDDFRNSQFTKTPVLPEVTKDPPGDELQRLSYTFAQMAQRIVDQMQALRQTDAARREWVTHLAHDLKTPLTSLHAHLETLLDETKLTPSERRLYVETAIRQTQGLAKMVKRLLDLAKLESNEIIPNLEPFQLSDLVQDVIQKFSLTSSAQGCSLVMEAPDDVPLVMADIGLIERVLENLIDNALQHTGAGGRIRVCLIPRGARVIVEVDDTGTGISAEQLPHIFDRFYRAEKERPGASEHAGLGLAIVKRILELHGVAITVESSPGLGSTFRFALPVVAPNAGHSSKTPALSSGDTALRSRPQRHPT